MSEQAQAQAACCGGRAVLIWALVAAAALIGSTLVLETWEWPLAAAVPIALAPMLPFVGLFVALVRASRRLDELQQRMQLEALGLTVVLASVVSTGVGQLQRIEVLGPSDYSMVYVLITAAYGVSYAIVRRRYA